MLLIARPDPMLLQAACGGDAQLHTLQKTFVAKKVTIGTHQDKLTT